MILVIACATGAHALAARQPNIVLFFVDDLGWSDVGYRNPGVFESPNIDRLAREGMDFEQCYVPTPTCSPSRGALLTGKHPARLELFRHITGGPDQEYSLYPSDPAQIPSRNWLPLEEVTYAEVLGELGYYNLFVGKWHLGHEKHFPIHQGFDRQIGTTHRGHPSSYYPDYFIDSAVFDEEEDRYLPDKLTDEVVQFIETYDRDQPFMLSFWYYSVHSPHIGRQDYVEHFKSKGYAGKYAEYLAMLKSVDDSIGRVRTALETKGIADDTVLIFLSDQGGYFENKPFRGGKMGGTALYEGGARVPFIIHWPGVTQSVKNASVVQTPDLFPTLIEIAGGDPRRFAERDGLSLLPVIRDNRVLQRGKPLIGYRGYEERYASVRAADWKLIAYRSGALELYNLAEDIGETKNVAAQHPDKVKALAAELVAWEKKMGLEKYSGVSNVKTTRASNNGGVRHYDIRDNGFVDVQRCCRD